MEIKSHRSFLIRTPHFNHIRKIKFQELLYLHIKMQRSIRILHLIIEKIN